jgi:hypothetical protein
MFFGRLSRVPGRVLQFAAAAIAVSAAVAAGAATVWVFRRAGAQTSQSVWHQLFSDRATLGFVRAAVIMLAIYTIGSLAALLASGRWIRSIGRGGLETDSAYSIEEQIAGLERKVRQADSDRERAERLLEVLLRG